MLECKSSVKGGVVGMGFGLVGLPTEDIPAGKSFTISRKQSPM